MALIQSTAIPSGASAYEIEQSLRFDTARGTYLSKATTGTATHNDKCTFSFWAKSLLLTQAKIFTKFADNDNRFYISLDNGGEIYVYSKVGGTQAFILKTDAILRDPSAWYHILIAFDTSQSTNTNRIKVYVNGTLQTDFDSGVDYPAQNEDLYVQTATQVKAVIGRYSDAATQIQSGYLAEFNFIDGAAKTPADFGETGTYGEWKPIEYEGTYGTNGFYLNFATSGLLAATGGTITTDGDYKVHTFTSSGTFTPDISGEVDYLVIAGGGGGGNGTSLGGGGGGGGAGGYKTGTADVTAQAYSITVGAGGTGGISGGSAPTVGANSIFSSFTATGGGKGGSYNSSSYVAGGNGGSGGGGGGNTPYTASGSGTVGQGNNGGVGLNSTGNGGGGGGASTVGASGTPVGGVGGAGLSSSITGSAVTRAGGGGGGGWGSSAGGAAGTGGGAGGAAGGNSGAAGTANTGGGGGGSGANLSTQGNGGAGGSGIVIIRYKFQ